MYRMSLYSLIFLVAMSLVGIVTGMVFARPLFTLLCAFAVILFMWLGFLLKAVQQKSDTRKQQ
ncbi:hypothetical protein NIE88_10820 [Sporolactobacillus shoreicorticis]|uniref:DUF1328 domain-containing protein n=1 Tax=Sporolactobacillus shoreicorticis TaxID=1923877 RepID=A0ABW5S561_9BACL|nr:hypothetical protein [Sporolactobacillus shoreicorticis]MCO7126267.1 hypothetical protein [Sporolactobacillus shoreicorticis]